MDIGKDRFGELGLGFSALLVHDESTFKSGETSPKRWMTDEYMPFFSKGQGRSHMLSDFMVQHPSGPFFSLSHAEFKRACEKYPSLLSAGDLNYVENLATAGINVGQDGYFTEKNSCRVINPPERVYK